jgi:hypothetical protein
MENCWGLQMEIQKEHLKEHCWGLQMEHQRETH